MGFLDVGWSILTLPFSSKWSSSISNITVFIQLEWRVITLSLEELWSVNPPHRLAISRSPGPLRWPRRKKFFWGPNNGKEVARWTTHTSDELILTARWFKMRSLNLRKCHLNCQVPFWWGLSNPFLSPRDYKKISLSRLDLQVFSA